MSMHGGGMTTYGLELANLSLSDPRCNNDSCIAYYAAHNASQKRAPWLRQFEYGHWTTWYYLIWLAIFCIVFKLTWLADRRIDTTSRKQDIGSKASLYQKLRALVRSVAYRRFSGAFFNSLGLPAWGMLLFLLAGVLFFCLLTFADRPYYRDHRGYGSPPIAVRTGLMATATTPLLVALAGKVNFVTLITGISHEKLNVVHRWVGWATLVISIVHTVPFIVAPLRDGGYAMLKKQFYKSGSYEYTGVPPLAMLFGLVAFSIPQIRRRIYETFYWLHWGLGVAYVGTLFWHAAGQIDSWAYLWATIALWIASILARCFWKVRTFNIHSEWMVGSNALLRKLPDSMTRIDVAAPEGFRWTPGQHCFLRFPSLSPFDNHPFTIASAPRAEKRLDGLLEKCKAIRNLTFLVRTHAGFTRKLESYVASHPDASSTVWIDGPYGGVDRKLEHVYDNVILVAGGSGITACLPWLEHFGNLMAADATQMAQVSLHWMIREHDHLEWARSELLRVLDHGLGGRIQVQIYVTGGANSATTPPRKEDGREQVAMEGKDVESISGSSEGLAEDKQRLVVHSRRPLIAEILPASLQLGRNLVISCGPESLKIDISNACAVAQSRVLKGELKEVALHTETFDW